MAVFEHQTELPCSAQGLFDFLSRPKNISLVGDPKLGITFVNPPEVVSEGCELEFQIVSFGQVHTMKHKIVECVSGSRMVEEQTVGPMKFWRHTHFYETIDGGCRMTDTVEFEPPGGLIGFFLTEDKIVDQLENGFFYREEKLNQLIEQGEIS